MQKNLKYFAPIFILSFFMTSSLILSAEKGFSPIAVNMMPSDSLEHLTYLGSSSDDVITAIFKTENRMIICGYTSSSDSIPFPTLPEDTVLGSNNVNIFVSLLSHELDVLHGSILIGGSGDDYLNAAQMTQDGELILCGMTNSTDFPVSDSSFQNQLAGEMDMFVMRLSAPYDSISYSTLFGGGGLDMGTALAVDSSGNIYSIGNTNSYFLPTADVAVYTDYNGGLGDVFFAKFNPTLDTLLSTAIIGGNFLDMASDIQINQDSTLIVLLNSENFNLIDSDPEQFSSPGGNGDVYLLETDLNFTEVLKAKVLGGEDLDMAKSLLVTEDGIFVTGYTRSDDLPTTENAVMPDMLFVDSVQAFILKLPAEMNAIEHLTYFGGTGYDIGYEMEYIDSNLYVIGMTNSYNFPTAGSPYSIEHIGMKDIFVSRFDFNMLLVSSSYLGETNDEELNYLTEDSPYLLNFPEDYIDLAAYSKRGNFMTIDSVHIAIISETRSDNFDIDFESYDQLYNWKLDAVGYVFEIDNICGGGYGIGNGNCSGGYGNPLSSEICEGADTMFTVGYQLLDAIYQWYFVTDSGFVDIVEDSIFSGVNNDTLFVNNVTMEMNGTWVQCFYTNTFHPLWSCTAGIYVYDNNPVVSIGLSDSLIFCPNDSVSLLAGGAQEYMWMDGSTDNPTNMVFNDSTTVWVIGSNLECGSDTAEIFVDVFPEPMPLNLMSTLDSVCLGDSIEISVSGAESYNWNPMILEEDSIFYPFSDTTIYVTGFDQNNCTSSDSLFISILPVPVIYSEVLPETCDQNNDGSITIEVESEVDFSIFWEGDFEGVYLTDLDTGTYVVEVINEFNCSVIENLIVLNDSSDCFYSYFVPTIFSPNNDGINDELYVRGSEIASFEFTLYSEWGVLIYSTTDLLESWDGKHLGNESPPGVYYYKLSGLFTNEGTFDVQSDITLVR